MPSLVRGFTLLELLVALALVGLVAAIAFPNLERLYASVTRSTERDYILDQFAGLGLRAMRQGRSFVVSGTGAPAASGPANPGAGLAPADPGSDTRVVAPVPLSAYTPYDIDLPQGWEVLLDPPLVVRASGVCLGATLTLRYQGEAESRIDLAAPWCRVSPDA